MKSPNRIHRRSALGVLLSPLATGCLPVPETGSQPDLPERLVSAEGNRPGNLLSKNASGPDGEASPADLASRHPLQVALDQALDAGFRRGLSTLENGAWQVLHGVLAYGQACWVQTPEGQRRVIEHLQQGGQLRGWDPRPGDMLGEPPRRGLRFEIEAGSLSGQGHADQWLAVLSQADLPPEAEFLIDGQVFSLEDALRQTLWDVPRNLEQEFSWTVIAVTAYRPTDFRWIARDGANWSVERLVEMETAAAVETAACGGTHRLIGLAMTLQRRRDEGKTLSGAWQAAEQRVQGAIDAARSFQNDDGSFATTFLHGFGWSPDMADVLRTTGHVLEFLAIAGDEATLRSDWVEAAAWNLCRVLSLTEAVSLECGALYHALHGVLLYRQRRFPEVAWQPPA